MGENVCKNRKLRPKMSENEQSRVFEEEERKAILMKKIEGNAEIIKKVQKKYLKGLNQQNLKPKRFPKDFLKTLSP